MSESKDMNVLKQQLMELRSEGKTLQEISDSMDIGVRTVQRWLNKFGLSGPVGRPDIEDSEILQLWQDGFTIVEIADKFKCTHETISRRLAKHGITCDRVSGIYRHFERVHGDVWPDMKLDLDSDMTLRDISTKYHMRMENVYRLMFLHSYLGMSGDFDKLSVTDMYKIYMGCKFKQKASVVHQDFYDYSQVEYVKTHDKVAIICPVHGVFYQSPANHLQGHGCPKCGAKVTQSKSVSKSNIASNCFSVSELTGTARNLNQIVKSYQFYAFYARELALWEENPEYRGKPLRDWLYENRKKYLGKSAEELTELEILRGFTISGILKGYTVFDVSLMDAVVKKYGIQSIYDPCAGWGERILYCYYNHLSYYGVDINENLIDGYEQMRKDFSFVDQDYCYGDSAIYDLTGHSAVDAVITCPPYGKQEIYSEAGAENLSKSEFLDWWRKVVENSQQLQPKYFCFQINQKWKDLMSEIVIACGYQLADEFRYKTNRSSHFTRQKGKNVKKEYDVMLVFERI